VTTFPADAVVLGVAIAVSVAVTGVGVAVARKLQEEINILKMQI
jgi:hypothetical protein